MIILIAGASHTGKTALAQRLLEKYHYPYVCIDHLKMGLIRSGNTSLTPADDEELTAYLWPIVREMIKTAIENGQNLVVEGCYIPFDWQKDFDEDYLKEIQYYCLILSKEYVEKHFSAVKQYANVIEERLDDSDLCAEKLIEENEYNLQMCKEHGCNYILVEDEYKVDIDL
ncbi:MAG: adenylate kinase [Roseburia sp.]|nr:adenylate kinase [Roseburia sp.]